MDFAIEAPGEANPLTTQTLLHILQSASSNDRQQITSGTEQLQNWEKTPGFYSGLQSIYMDYSLPTELRYIAIIKLKNGVDKYWRKTALNAIKKEEKELIRTRSIESGVVEPDHRLALQISIATAKICRYEFPQDWPDVMETVLEKFHSASATSSNPVYLHRVVTILLYIVKELSTARIQRSRTSLQNVAPDIVRSLSIVYNERYCMWVNLMKSRTSDEGEALKSMEHSLIILRVLRRLIIAGYDFPNRSLEIQQIWGILATHFGELLALVQGNLSNLGANSQYLVDKHLFQIGKLHVDMVKSRPTGYALLPNSTGLAREYWGLARQYGETLRYQTPTVSAKVGTDGDADPNEKILVQEKLTLKGLLLIRACMKMVFNPAQTFKFQKDEDKEEKKLSKDLMKNELLSGSFAREAMETLVMRFFVFTSRDLRAWEEEPDEWEKTQESGGDDWEFSLRSCSEKLFLDLLINYKDLLIEPLLNVFTTVASMSNPSPS